MISNAGLIAVFLRPRTLVASQAWGIGFTILERSKGLIYSDYYKKIKPALNGKCSVIFTDTDSLCLRINAGLTPEIILDRLADVLDFSNYPKTHERFSTDRQNKLGFWKDEMCGG